MKQKEWKNTPEAAKTQPQAAQGDSESSQNISITHPVDVIVRASGDAVLAGINADGRVESVSVSGGAMTLENLLTGKDSANNKRVLLIEDDRTLREQLVLWRSGAPERWQADSSGGEAKIMNYGYNGAANTRYLLETTGEQKFTVHGKDESNNIDALRTSSDRILWTREYQHYYGNVTTSVLIAGAEGIVYDPGVGASIILEVYFQVVNVNAGAAAVTGVYVGRDDAGGGGLAGAEYWMFNETIPYPGTSGWRGPFLMDGTDDIRAVAAVGNACVIHINAKRVDNLA